MSKKKVINCNMESVLYDKVDRIRQLVWRLEAQIKTMSPSARRFSLTQNLKVRKAEWDEAYAAYDQFLERIEMAKTITAFRILQDNDQYAERMRSWLQCNDADFYAYVKNGATEAELTRLCEDDEYSFEVLPSMRDAGKVYMIGKSRPKWTWYCHLDIYLVIEFGDPNDHAALMDEYPDHEAIYEYEYHT